MTTLLRVWVLVGALAGFLGGLLALGDASAWAGKPVSLFDLTKPNYGWGFNRGQEFPGAEGEIAITNPREVPQILAIRGDFTNGGAYVSAGRRFEPTQVDYISFKLKSKGGQKLTLRVIDDKGTCHQFKLTITKGWGWQTVKFPIKDYFLQKGTKKAVKGVSHYESWGKSKDKKDKKATEFSGTINAVHFVLSPQNLDGQKKGSLQLRSVKVYPVRS